VHVRQNGHTPILSLSIMPPTVVSACADFREAQGDGGGPLGVKGADGLGTQVPFRVPVLCIRVRGRAPVAHSRTELDHSCTKYWRSVDCLYQSSHLRL
jgi:hypothetical protein